MKPRQSIAAKVRAARPKAEPVDLSPEEAVDVSMMIDELGQHEKKAVRHDRIITEKVAQIETLTAERNEAERRANAAARTVRDTFIASLLAAGKTPAAAIHLADVTMELRDLRDEPRRQEPQP